MPRLKAFALALAGSDNAALALLRATRSHALANVDRERGHAPVTLWTLMQMRRIWAKKSSGKNAGGAQVDPRLFQPISRIDDGGTSARFAMKISRLEASQRGLLHLVYGERLSYDEAAEIFDISVSEVIAALVSAHKAIAGQASAQPRQDAEQQPFPYEKSARQQERAA
jgi:DNA-directed RNA polymerase specialized sigma24 family protein